MNESGYQKKIIKSIEDIGGVAINGNFTTAGTADLICGYPINSILPKYSDIYEDIPTILLHLHVEVKTKYDYERVFRSIHEVNGYYAFKEDIKSLKKHEYLQITKLNKIRKAGGMALIAYSFEQVQDYVKGKTYDGE